MSSTGSTQNLSQALRQIVSGAYVLTLKDAQTGPQAILLSFVQQVGFDPPRIIVSIYKERPIVPALERTRGFVLNVCAEGDQSLLKRFFESPEAVAKALTELLASETGPGLILAPASAYLVCKVVERVDIGDHWLYIADVSEGATITGRTPLVHVRRSGLRY